MFGVRHFPINIDGITIQFPYQPYETQVEYMRSVVDCLKNGRNGLLESPTGTGKTLSLICATLGWLQNGQTKTTIYYTSRTHAQLAQVAKELKRSAYSRVPSVVIGSRSQTCLNDEVRQQGADHLINRACRNAITKNACQYYTNYEQKLETLDTNQVHDIETLGDWGRKHQCCPFYASKVLAESKASMNIMPYNYLLDSQIMKSFQLKLENSVIIIDEAHNVDSVLKDAVSGQFSKNCLKIVQDCCRELPRKVSDALNKEKHGLSRFGFQPKERKQQPTIVEEFIVRGKQSNKPTKEPKEPKVNLIEELAEKLTAEKLQQVNNCAIQLESETLSIVEVDKTNSIDKVMKLLRNVNVEYRTSDSLITTLESMISFYSIAGVMNPVHVAKSVAAISNLGNFITLLFPKENLSVQKQRDHEKKLNEYYISFCEGIYEKGNIVLDYKGGELKDWILNIWCLHPAIGLQKVINSNTIRGPKSIILTSGTLSPMEPLERDLEIPFKVIKQFNHVIAKDQFKIMIVGESPDYYSLRSNFQSTEKDEYKRAIGKTLLALFKILPYGTLVFFSSYSLMTKVIRYWKDKSNIWSEMMASTNVFIESRTQDSFNLDMLNYKRKLETKNSRAVYFGVCRGKLSEGINLIGNQCKTVIMTGLPFPNNQDQKVLATRKFQGKRCNNDGGVWYTQQMTRALNQTVGRVIRSKDDHGMLILCDPRFKDYKYSLSEWTRPFIPNNDIKIGDIESEIRSFFEFHGHKISGSISETVGAFEVGFNKTSTKPPSATSATTAANKSLVSGNIFKTTKSKNSNIDEEGPKTTNLREAMMAQYRVDQETYDRVQSQRLAILPAPDADSQLSQPEVTNIPQPQASQGAASTKSRSSTNNNSQKIKTTQDFMDELMNYSILNQYKDKDRPSDYTCYICSNEAKIPYRTNCKCARVACLSEIKILNKKKCGKCGMEYRLKDFKQCLFKSAFHKRERQPVIMFSGKNKKRKETEID